MEKIDEVDIHCLILEILDAQKSVLYKPKNKVEEVLKFKYPSASQRLKSHFIEDQKIKESIEMGLFSESNPPQEFVLHFFSSADLDNLNELESKVKGYELLLSKRMKGTEKYEEDKQKLYKLKQERDLLSLRKDLYKQFSAEARAREDMNYYLLSECTFTEDNIRRWNSLEDMMNKEPMSGLIGLLVDFLSFYWGPDTSTIRKIARSGQWRNIYIGATKAGLKLFEGTAKDLTIPQLQLLSWSMQYQSAYELPSDERPSDDIIEDDDRFDDFMKEYIKKIKSGNSSSFKKSKNRPALDQQHAIVTAESKDYVRLHKENLYSDTSSITGRAKDENSTSYKDIEEIKEVRNKISKLGRKTPSNRLGRRK